MNINTKIEPEERIIISDIKGTLTQLNKNYGFMTAEGGQYFVDPETTKMLIKGDIVKGNVIEFNGRRKFQVDELIESTTDKFIGRARIKNGSVFVEPENISETRWFFVEPSHGATIEENDWLYVKLSRHPFLNTDGKKSVALINNLGKDDDPDLPWEYTLAKANAEFNKYPTVSVKSLHGFVKDRSKDIIDLTKVEFVTIDSEYARDIDDAIHVEKKEEMLI